QARHRAASTTMRWPAARADRMRCRRSSSMSRRDSPSSRASDDTDRGSAINTARRARRNVILRSMNNVAFLGTGLLGAGMAERMLAQGDRVTVWNRTASKARALEQAGAAVAPSAAEAVTAADHVHLALTDDAVVDAILAEMLPRLPHG